MRLPMMLYGTIISSALLLAVLTAVSCERSFYVDMEHDTFIKDGKPFRYISGSMHYFRSPRASWRDRLQKAYAAGLDAVQFYIPWNYHEYEPGLYDFGGEKNVFDWLDAVNEAGLLAILRLGPYICGEWDLGGLPVWLLAKNSSVVLRSTDPQYLPYVQRWFNQLLPLLRRYLYSAGGPIIMIQIENEYGWFLTCSQDYLKTLYDSVRANVGNETLIFTTDGCGGQKCGSLSGYAYATVDFLPSQDYVSCFADQRTANGGHGPLVNSEFYTGWLDEWGTAHSRSDAKMFADSLDKLLSMNASVNMYMFHGGTTWGFWNGANYPPYQTQPTSYDYDAPLNEAGDTTNKYMQIRQVIGKYKQLPRVPIPPNSTKTAYGRVQLSPLFDLRSYINSGNVTGLKFDYPRAFEQIGVWQGFVLYSTQSAQQLPAGTLNLTGVKDRAYLFNQDWDLLAIVDRADPDSHKLVSVEASNGFFILVENRGHINFGTGIIGDWKGLVENVTLVTATKDTLVLRNWIMYHIDMANVYQSAAIPQNEAANQRKRPLKYQKQFIPGFYEGFFSVDGAPNDTFIRMDGPQGWSKGQILLNGFNLGRYWPTAGPQVTLFVPASFLKAQNRIVMFELEGNSCSSLLDAGDNCFVTLVDTPYIDKPVSQESDYSLQSNGYTDPKLLHL